MHSFFNGTSSANAGSWDAIYARYLLDIFRQGDDFEGRNGVTKSLFGASATADLRRGFPLIRLRKMPFKNLIREFLFDIGKDQNVEALGPAKHFWDFLADKEGYLGASAYNRQWRMWPQSAPGASVRNEQLENLQSVDQLKHTIEELRKSPNTRRATVITHNPTAIDPACPPCHLAMQFTPRPDGSLDMMVPARSNDMVVGFPLDIARYGIILTVVARASFKEPGRVYMPSSNSHIYENCYEIAEQLIKRPAKGECHLVLDEGWDGDIDTLTLDSFSLEDYNPEPAIKIAVN